MKERTKATTTIDDDPAAHLHHHRYEVSNREQQATTTDLASLAQPQNQPHPPSSSHDSSISLSLLHCDSMARHGYCHGAQATREALAVKRVAYTCSVGLRGVSWCHCHCRCRCCRYCCCCCPRLDLEAFLLGLR